MSFATKILALALVLSALAACAESETLGQASCPTGGTKLTWQSFGQGFFQSYCNECHSAGVGSRNGAPTDVAFDTHDAIAPLAAQIYADSADANDSMPPGPDDPPLAERQKLGEWLACGAP